MNKPKIIVLYGKGHCGKTTTLNLLIEKLISSDAVVLGGMPASNPEENCWIVLEYQGRRIGIITVGDDGKILDDYFHKLSTDCDIYVCASRTKGSSCKYITDTFPSILWLEKWSVSQEGNTTASLKKLRSDANEKQAWGLITAINAL